MSKGFRLSEWVHADADNGSISANGCCLFGDEIIEHIRTLEAKLDACTCGARTLWSEPTLEQIEQAKAEGKRLGDYIAKEARKKSP